MSVEPNATVTTLIAATKGARCHHSDSNYRMPAVQRQVR